MQIEGIHIYCINLPFAGSFSHSLRKISSAANIIVEVVAENGSVKGYGEGAPRPYVTGETQNEAAERVRTLIQLSHFPWRIEDIHQVWAFVDSLPPEKNDNAAICALETSLLDAFGKYQKKSITDYFSKDFYTETICYGVGIPLDHQPRIEEICRLIKKEMNITRLKLKMGKDFSQNKDALETIQTVFEDDFDLKIDVNGVWDRVLAYDHIPLIEKFNVKVVEQPMAPGDSGIVEFVKHMESIGVILMADESACDLGEVHGISNEGAYKMINIRLSKCGGFRRTFQIIDFLRANHMSFQIGCHLGETGILSAAGRALSLLCRDATYYDGSYDAFLLKENVTTKDVSFDHAGIAGPLSGNGLGVQIDPDRLKRLSNGMISISAPAH